MDTIEIWAQIHDVPDLYAHPVPSLAAKLGEVLYAKPPSQDFAGNFYRVWIRIVAMKPLKNDVSMIQDSHRQIYRVKYEKLPDWCIVCGMLGHLYKEHGIRIHPPSALVFKELRADWFMRSGRGPGGGRGSQGGRRVGRNGGRGPTPAPGTQEVFEEYTNPDNVEGITIVMLGRDGRKAASDIVMEDPSRKRNERIEPGSNPSATPLLHATVSAGDRLALVPAST